MEVAEGDQANNEKVEVKVADGDQVNDEDVEVEVAVGDRQTMKKFRWKL